MLTCLFWVEFNLLREIPQSRSTGLGWLAFSVVPRSSVWFTHTVLRVWETRLATLVSRPGMKLTWQHSLFRHFQSFSHDLILSFLHPITTSVPQRGLVMYTWKQQYIQDTQVWCMLHMKHSLASMCLFTQSTMHKNKLQIGSYTNGWHGKKLNHVQRLWPNIDDVYGSEELWIVRTNYITIHSVLLHLQGLPQGKNGWSIIDDVSIRFCWINTPTHIIIMASTLKDSVSLVPLKTQFTSGNLFMVIFHIAHGRKTPTAEEHDILMGNDK